jgi:hypothetical protein
MPANLTPDYKAAEAAFRKARDPRERLEYLREMLRVIPKHKGTGHLQADIKHRIKELSEELERPKKSGAHGGPPLVRARRKLPSSPAQYGKVVAARAAHGLGRASRAVSVHHSVS